MSLYVVNRSVRYYYEAMKGVSSPMLVDEYSDRTLAEHTFEVYQINQTFMKLIERASYPTFLSMYFQVRINFDKSAEIFIIEICWNSPNIVDFIRVIYLKYGRRNVE